MVRFDSSHGRSNFCLLAISTVIVKYTYCTMLCRWYVPVIWGAVSTACLCQIYLRHSQGMSTICLLLACGVVLWQFTEYCIHRFLFHVQPTSYWGITLHFTFHGCHHKWPLDSLRLVFPPVPAAPIIAGVFFTMHKMMPQVGSCLLHRTKSIHMSSDLHCITAINLADLHVVSFMDMCNQHAHVHVKLACKGPHLCMRFMLNNPSNLGPSCQRACTS